MLEALACDLPCLGSNIPGIRDILKYRELMFDPLNGRDVCDRIRLFFTENTFLTRARQLCQERKEAFTFDWKERLFQMIKSEYEET